jgi:thermitase
VRGDACGGVGAFGAEARADDTGMSADTAEAFRNALWFFVEPSPTTERAMEAPEAVANADAAGKLVKRPNGRFGIATKRLNVQLREDISETDAEQALADRGLQLLTRLRFAPNLFEVDTTAHEDAFAASVELSDDPRFTLAEPSLIEHVPVRLTPTDPRYGEQWQWANTGQSGGTVGADVHAEAAWDRTRGAGIRVAVIDNGFNAAHEDLQAGVVGASGFFRQVGVNPVTFVQGTAGMPGGDHGTFCAGMAGARQNNVRGGCGAAPECDLMLVACLGDQVGTQTTLARAISYAADPSTEVAGADPATGADIVVSSLGPNGAAWDLTATLQLALEFAALQGRGGRGLAIFWAASNGDNVDVLQDEVVSHADVIAVVRSTRRDLEDNAARGRADRARCRCGEHDRRRRVWPEHRHQFRRTVRGGLRRARPIDEPCADPRRAAPDHARLWRQDRGCRLRRERPQRRLRVRTGECPAGGGASRESTALTRSGQCDRPGPPDPRVGLDPGGLRQRRRNVEHHQRAGPELRPGLGPPTRGAAGAG